MLVSRLIASLMVFREAEYASLSPSSVGSWLPGLRAAGSWPSGSTAAVSPLSGGRVAPSSIRLRRSSAICRYMGC